MVDKNFLLIVFLVLQVSQVSSFPGSAIGANLTERHLRFRREVDCEKLLGGVTLQQIIDAECTEIKPASGQLEINIVEKPNNWDNFAANLSIIEGITFVFENSHLQEVAFPKLQSAKSSGFNFTNNPQLTSITIKTTSCLNASLDISDNPSLTTVTLAAGSNIKLSGEPYVIHTHTVRINNNPELKTIDMFGIEEIFIEGEFVIKDNVKLEEIIPGSLENVGVIKFDLSGNKALKTFELPELNSLTIHESAAIKKNDKLWGIYFSRRMKSAKVNSLEIAQNKKLAIIEIDYLKIEAPILKVRGNPNLPMGILTQLDTIQSYSKDIQEIGECIFDRPIKDFADLDDCVIINSEVWFASSTGGYSKNKTLKIINGDVYLSSLSHHKVKFLANVKINGTISSDVCNFKLGNHSVVTPAMCSSTTATLSIAFTSKTTTATPITPAAIGPKNRHAHGRRSSARPAIKIHNCETIFVPVYAVIFVVVMTTFACRYIQVPAGGDETGEIELYKRVFPSCNKRKPDIEKGRDARDTDMNQVASYERQERRRPVWEQRSAASRAKEVPQVATAPSRPSPEVKEAATQSNGPRTTAL